MRKGANLRSRKKSKSSSVVPAYVFSTGNRDGDIMTYLLRIDPSCDTGSHSPFHKPTREDVETVGRGDDEFFSEENDTDSIISSDYPDNLLLGPSCQFDLHSEMQDEVSLFDSTPKESVKKMRSQIKIIKNAHEKSIYSLLYSQDGMKLFSGAYDRIIKVWQRLGTNMICVMSLTGHSDVVCSLTLTPKRTGEKDERFLCSSSYDKSIRLWDLATGTEIRTITGGNIDSCADEADQAKDEFRHLNRINSVEFCKTDGISLYSASTDKTVKKWNIAMDQMRARGFQERAFSHDPKAKAGIERATCLALPRLPNANILKSHDILVTAGVRQTNQPGRKEIIQGFVTIWQCKEGLSYTCPTDLTNATKCKEKQIHSGRVESIAISNNGARIVSIGSDKNVLTWKFVKNTWKFDGQYKMNRKGHSIALSEADKEDFFVGIGDGVLQRWKFQEDPEIRAKSTCYKEYRSTSDKQAHSGWIMAICVTSDGKTMVTGSHNNDVKVWDLDLDKHIKTLGYVRVDSRTQESRHDHKGPIRDIALSNDDKFAITGSEDSTVKIWNIEKEKKEVFGQLLATLEGHSHSINSVSISQDGTKIVSGSSDKSWKLWGRSSNPDDYQFKVVYTSGQGSRNRARLPIKAVSFSTDDAFVLCLESQDKTENEADYISCEKIDMIHFSLPSVVQECMFDYDCAREDEGSKLMDWNEAETTMALRNNPLILVEPLFAYEGKGWGEISTVEIEGHNQGKVTHNIQNLIHAAASDGRSNFLATCLFFPENQQKQKIALKSLLMKDAKGDLPIDRAIHFRSGPTVQEIFKGFSLLLSQDFAGSFYAKQSSQEIHPSELFPLESLCKALEIFPDIALEFVESLQLVNSGDHFVQRGVKRHELPKTNRLIKGSELRAPRNFWKNQAEEERMESMNNDRRSAILRIIELLLSLYYFLMGAFVSSHSVSQDVEISRSSLGVSVWEKERKYRRNESGDPVTAKIVPIKGVAGPESKFLSALTKAAQTAKKHKVFENEVVRTIIEHKWNAYANLLFRTHMCCYIAFVLCLTLDAVFDRTVVRGLDLECVVNTHIIDKCEIGVPDHVTPKSFWWRIPFVLSVILWLFFAIHEYKQMKNSVSKLDHIKDFWNIMDISSLTLVYASYTLRILHWAGFQNINRTPSTITLALALPITWVKMLYYMQGFDESGKLVRMILGIMWGIKDFLLILIVCMVGFAVSFFILCEGQVNADGRHVSPFMSIFSSYVLLLGEFEFVEDFDKSRHIVISVLFVLFTLFINIIMLNLLIAIMGDIFDRIQENAKAEFIFARAQIIIEFEGALNFLIPQNIRKREEENWFPTWLQVLTPQQVDFSEYEEDEWNGRLRAVLRRVDTIERKMKRIDEIGREQKRHIGLCREEVQEGMCKIEKLIVMKDDKGRQSRAKLSRLNKLAFLKKVSKEQGTSL
mmetsp:Transcript_6199/g.12871  ORF Transcript_6199/g.12871 Transcript_6199/m.12871 type:complete len:1433 (-) Transcript_6199:1267-5565(-)